MQQTYNPAKFDFNWTADGWYEWDRDAAHKAARKLRDVHAATIKAQGRKVTKFSLPSQLITLGGIGSGRPQIEVVVTVYGFNAN